MTTFEQAVLCCIIVIIVLLFVIAKLLCDLHSTTESKLYWIKQKLDNIDTNTATSVSVDIETRDEVKHIDTILHNGFEEVGRPNGGCYINPQWKH